MQRAYDFQAWCGTDMALSSYWDDRGLNNWVLVQNGAIAQMSLESAPGLNYGVPFGNYYGNPGGALYMQDDGNLVLYENGTPLFATNTSGHGCGNGCFAQFQGDGNLVLYENGGAFWQSGTGAGEIPYYGQHLEFSYGQPNVRVTSSANSIVWSSCMSGGDQNTIQGVLNTGPGAHAILCRGSQFYLGDTVYFRAPAQAISTEGYPGDDSRARLTVEGGASTAIQGSNQNAIAIQNIIVNGNRTGAPINGAALIEIGGFASQQVVSGVQAYDPRGWSTLHIAEGDVAGGQFCTGAQISNNTIGPAGYGYWEGNWADGISLGCANSVVSGNLIQDVSDGGIVVFGAPGSQIVGNTIVTTWNTLNGGINMVDYAPWNGNYNGTLVAYNTVTAAGGFIKIGIAIGPQTWGINAPAVYGGTVYGNVLNGGNMGYGLSGSQFYNFTILETNFSAGYRGNTGNCGPGFPAPQAYVFGEGISNSNLQPGFASARNANSLCIN